MSKDAITIKDLHISYRTLKGFSIKNLLILKRNYYDR